MKITVKTGYKESFKIGKKALGQLSISISECSFDEGYITGFTKTSFLSWGEIIELEFFEISNNKTVIQISSEASAQMISWGRNKRNLLRIKDKIYEILKSRR